MSERGYSRRSFLFLAGAVGSAVMLGIGWAAKRGAERALATQLPELLGGLEAARAIGSIWLIAHPDGPADLTSALIADLGSRARFAGPIEIRRLIAEQVEADYTAGRVEQVGGWVLSRTEIRLCALAAAVATTPTGSQATAPERR